MRTISCPNCIILADLVRDLAQQLMAFHAAGRSLAESQAIIARAESDVRREAASLARAEATRLHAEIAAGHAEPIPMPSYGGPGHTRTKLTD